MKNIKFAAIIITVILIIFVSYNLYHAVSGINAYIDAADKLLKMQDTYNMQELVKLNKTITESVPLANTFNTISKYTKQMQLSGIFLNIDVLYTFIVHGFMIALLAIIPLTLIYIDLYKHSKDKRRLTTVSICIEGVMFLVMLFIAFMPVGERGIVQVLRDFRAVVLLLILGAVVINHSIASSLAMTLSKREKKGK